LAANKTLPVDCRQGQRDYRTFDTKQRNQKPKSRVTDCRYRLPSLAHAGIWTCACEQWTTHLPLRNDFQGDPKRQHSRDSTRE